MLGMQLFLLCLLFFGFGAVAGTIITVLRFRFSAAFARRLSGNGEAPPPLLKDEHKTAVIVGLSIVTVACIIAIPVLIYNLRTLESHETEARLMLEHGYRYVPSRLASWEKVDKTLHKLQHENDEIDVSPGEVTGSQRDFSEILKKER